MAQVGANVPQHVDDLERRHLVPAGVDQQRRAGDALGPAGRAQHLALVVRQRPRAAHLADDARLHAGAVGSLRNVADNLGDQLVLGALVHVLRVGQVGVVGRAHDHRDARLPGYVHQGLGVAAYADAGCVYQGLAAPLDVHPHLVDGRLDVVEPRVVHVGHVVVADHAQVFQSERLVVHLRGQRLGRVAGEPGQVDEQVLVAQCDAEVAGLDGPEHRLHSARDRWDVHWLVWLLFRRLRRGVLYDGGPSPRKPGAPTCGQLFRVGGTSAPSDPWMPAPASARTGSSRA